VAKTILQEIAVTLRDGVSGNAKQVASSLGAVDRALKNFGRGGISGDPAAALERMRAAAERLASSGVKLGQWGSQLNSQLSKLGASDQYIARLERRWIALHRAMKDVSAPEIRSAHISRFRSQAVSELLQVQAAARSTSSALSNIGSGMGAASARMATSARAMQTAMRPLSTATYMLGFGAAGYATQRGVRGGLMAGGEAQREEFRKEMAGITPAESAKLRQASLDATGRYKSLDVTKVSELGRNLYNLMGNMDKGLDLLDPFAKMLTVIQSTKGVKAAETELDSLAKSLDIMGRQEDPQRVRKLLDMVTKAVQVEGNQLKVGDFLTFARRSKLAGLTLSDDFLGQIAASGIQEMGAANFGTQLGTTLSQVANNRGTSASKLVQAEYGLREMEPTYHTRGKKKGKLKGSEPGNVAGRDLLMTNPFEWAQQHLVPALLKKGVDIKDEAKVGQILGDMFSNQNVASMMTRFVTQAEQYKRNKELYERAMGLDAAESVTGKDPFVAAQSVFEQMGRLISLLAVEGGAGERATNFLKGVGDAVAGLTDLMRASESAPKIVGGLASIAGGIALLGAAVSALRVVAWGLSLPTLLRAVTGGAGAVAAGGVAAGAVAGAAGGAALGTGTAAGVGAAAATTAGRVATLAGRIAFLGTVISAVQIGMDLYDWMKNPARQKQSKEDQEARARAMPDTHNSFLTEAGRAKLGLKSKQEIFAGHAREFLGLPGDAAFGGILGSEQGRPSRVKMGGGEYALPPEFYDRYKGRFGADAGPSSAPAEAVNAVKGDVTSAANADLTGAGTTTMQTYATGLQSAGQAAVAAAQAVYAQIKSVFDTPIAAKITVQSTGAAAGSAEPSATARAAGGPVSAGGMYRVGESGPEYFQPGTAGSIIPSGSGGGKKAAPSMNAAFKFDINMNGGNGGVDTRELVAEMQAAFDSKMRDIVRSMYNDYGIEEAG